MRQRNDLERGFSLMEALVGAVIAVIAVLGLAHSFGLGRALVNRYEVARAASGAAQDRMAALSLLPSTHPDLTIGVHPATPDSFRYEGNGIGIRWWRVDPWNDPATTAAVDLKQVTVMVRWRAGALNDSLSLQRLFPL